MRAYLSFARQNWRLLAFGVLLTSFSGFGQTFFVSLFGAEIRAENALSHGGFGAIYSVATLASAVCIAFVGRAIDRVSLRRFTLFVALGLTVACIGMSVARGLVALTITLFALRLSGQGLMTHTAMTTLARYFDRDRGKAVSVALIGFPLAQSTLPSLAIAGMAWVGWRHTWLACAAAMPVVAAVAVWLCRSPERQGATKSESSAAPARRSWTRAEVLRDPSFYLVTPAKVAPAFLLTGWFFHQAHLAEAKGWSLAWIARCFIGYSVAMLAASLLAGPLVDRFSARRLIKWVLIPLGVALLPLALSRAEVAALGYMIAAGFASGLMGTVSSALWAEVYGVAHLGAIRSISVAVAVLSTSASPVAMGWLIDRGTTVENLAWLSVAFCAFAFALALAAFRGREIGE